MKLLCAIFLATMSLSPVLAAVTPLKELVIVDRLVVENHRALPGGPWHFGTLIREMLPSQATAEEITEFVRAWVEGWDVPQINGFEIAPRPQARETIYCRWVNASTGGTSCNGNIDLNLAPFRLLGIVNRMDVRKATTAGDARLVFALLSKPTANPIDPAIAVEKFTFLVGYALPTGGGMDVTRWSNEWHQLGSFPCTTNTNCERYRDALASLTNRFTRRNVTPGKPNGSALSEIRTNEVALGTTWELREFLYVEESRKLRLVPGTVNRTPHHSLNNHADLIDWARANESDILAEKHAVPKPLLGGSAFASIATEFKWVLNGVSEEVRFKFSKNTCNGCHREERDKIIAIDDFYHISPLRSAGVTRLSSFLRDEEIPRRKSDLEALLGLSSN